MSARNIAGGLARGNIRSDNMPLKPMVHPNWATELLQQVCKDESRSFKKSPKFNWGYSRVSKFSSGHYNPRSNVIRVVQGTSGEDHKQVLLHEICHWLTRPRGSTKRVFFYGERRKKKNWHGKKFYVKLNQLLTRYDCLTTAYRERENSYMKRSANYL